MCQSVPGTGDAGGKVRVVPCFSGSRCPGGRCCSLPGFSMNEKKRGGALMVFALTESISESQGQLLPALDEAHPLVL